MEVRELRIGNLVSYDNRVFEIDTIAKEFPTLNTIDFGIGVVDWNNIEPIPITEEWLIKFGFIFVQFSLKKDYKKFISIEGIRINIYKDIPCAFIVLNRSTKQLKYIHQLQNLYFALTQKELEINE